MNKWYIHTMEHYVTVKKWGRALWTDWNDFQDIQLNEKSKVQKGTMVHYPSCKKEGDIENKRVSVYGTKDMQEW